MQSQIFNVRIVLLVFFATFLVYPNDVLAQLDTNCVIIPVSPVSTSATSGTETKVFDVIGIPYDSYRPDLMLSSGLAGVSVTPNISNLKVKIETFSTFRPTFRNGAWRIDGRITLEIPIEANIQHRVYTLTVTIRAEIAGRAISVKYNSTTFTVSPATSIRDLTLPNPITLSPNPVHEALTLTLPENDLHTARLRTALGTSVSALSDASGATTLAMDGLAAGVYFVEVESRTTRRRWVQKVVKY